MHFLFLFQAMQWGRMHEGTAVAEYEAARGIKTERCGLFIDPTCCWLGASPDRFVPGESSAMAGLVEIKCPFSAADSTIQEYATKRGSCLQLVNGEVALKRSHNYYHHIIGQMGIANVPWCDFVVWTTKGMFVERVAFNEDHWFSFRRQLTDFYFEFMLPLL